VRRRIGVAGRPRCIWVVDNEEVDRGLIVSLLQPLGFTIRQAASGEECLRALQEAGGALPDAIFMDLAMPGIDGWETLRRIRAQGLLPAGTPAAIVSANAFDKGLDNDVGIEPGDFLVKPVRVSELLDWLGRRLALQWIEAEAPAAEPVLHAPGAPARPPAPEVPLRIDPERLRALRDAIGIGHVRGVMRELDRIEAAQPECAGLVGRLRALARQFQLDAMNGLLRRTLDENDPRDGHDDTDERSR
jgi:CheY-like chemotaxis protein